MLHTCSLSPFTSRGASVCIVNQRLVEHVLRNFFCVLLALRPDQFPHVQIVNVDYRHGASKLPSTKFFSMFWQSLVVGSPFCDLFNHVCCRGKVGFSPFGLFVELELLLVKLHI